MVTYVIFLFEIQIEVSHDDHRALALRSMKIQEQQQLLIDQLQAVVV
jgi:hypothetical protein